MAMEEFPPKTVLVPVSVQRENPLLRFLGSQLREGGAEGLLASPSSEGAFGVSLPRAGVLGVAGVPVGELVLGKKSSEMVKLALEKLVMSGDTLILLLVQPPPEFLDAKGLRAYEKDLTGHLCNQLRTHIDVANAQRIRVVVEARLSSDRVDTVLRCVGEFCPEIVLYRASVMGALGVQSQGLDIDMSAEALAAALPRSTKVMVAYHGRILKSLSGRQGRVGESESTVTSDHQYQVAPARPLGPAGTSIPEQILQCVYGETEFRLEELLQATEGFCSRHEIGQGGCGKVYRGMLRGVNVAVKRLKWWGATAGVNPSVLRGDQTLRQFMMELKVMKRTHHRHLLQLRGVCVCDAELLLVFDLLPQGSLDHRLRDDRRILSWNQRLQIAVGAAAGLRYLHQDCNPPIIHRDVKTSNILLDNNLMPQVADFGLAKIAPEADSSQAFTVSAVMGTQGYAAPEYLRTRRVNWAVDVFAFGVVLLELISGHVAFHPDRTPPFLSEHAVAVAMDKQYWRLVDRRLQGVPHSQLENVLMLAILCLSPNPSERLRMHEVQHLLEKIVLQGH